MYKNYVFDLMISVLALGVVFAGGGKENTVVDSRPTIRLITDLTGIDDKSFNAAAWRGILEYYGDTWENQSKRGELYDVVTCQTQDAYVPTLKQASDEGYDLIVTTGFTFADALDEVAQLYPDQRYMIVDVDYVNHPNVMQFIFKEEQGSYLVGVAAAMQAKEDGIENPKFGFIGGVPGATITKFEIGYIQGLKSVFPDAEIVDEGGLPDYAIWLIVIGCVVVAAAIIAVPVVISSKKKAAKKREEEATVNAYKRKKIDTTDDKSIDVYADEEKAEEASEEAEEELSEAEETPAEESANE